MEDSKKEEAFNHMISYLISILENKFSHKPKLVTKYNPKYLVNDSINCTCCNMNVHIFKKDNHILFCEKTKDRYSYLITYEDSSSFESYKKMLDSYSKNFDTCDNFLIKNILGSN